MREGGRKGRQREEENGDVRKVKKKKFLILEILSIFYVKDRFEMLIKIQKIIFMMLYY